MTVELRFDTGIGYGCAVLEGGGDSGGADLADVDNVGVCVCSCCITLTIQKTIQNNNHQKPSDHPWKDSEEDDNNDNIFTTSHDNDSDTSSNNTSTSSGQDGKSANKLLREENMACSECMCTTTTHQ